MDEFYAEVESWTDPGASKGGTRMRQLISRINEQFSKTGIWGLTSHVHLLLKASPDLDEPWFVSVVSYGEETVIEYRMPAREAPWKEAVVRGSANDLETSMKYIRLAMIESGGWPHILELRNVESRAVDELDR